MGCRYNSPVVQVILVGFVCFCCPGMFNALTGMDGGGQLDPSAADSANTALYDAFAVSGVLGGAANNLLGPRLCLLLGSLYAASFLHYSHYHHASFPVAAGTILGAGLLWAAQGSVVSSYPLSARRGSSISLFWLVFNLGGVLGGLLPFALNYRLPPGARPSAVSDSTYIAFMCFMFLGALLSLLILPPSAVVRDDGTRPTALAYSRSVPAEALVLLRLFRDWRMLLLFLPAWASNFFYAYRFNNVNAALFNLRTRGLNVFYWGAQMAGSVAIGYLLDHAPGGRRRWGVAGVAVAAAIGTAVWAGGLASQLRVNEGQELLDFKESGHRYAPALLYFSYDLLDAMFQTLVYWVIGALGNDSEVLSRYIGFYKGVQSAGAAVTWQVEKHRTPPVTQLIINWTFTTISYPLLVVLIVFAVDDNQPVAKEKDSNSKNKLSGCEEQ